MTVPFDEVRFQPHPVKEGEIDRLDCSLHLDFGWFDTVASSFCESLWIDTVVNWFGKLMESVAFFLTLSSKLAMQVLVLQSCNSQATSQNSLPFQWKLRIQIDGISSTKLHYKWSSSIHWTCNSCWRFRWLWRKKVIYCQIDLYPDQSIIWYDYCNILRLYDDVRGVSVALLSQSIWMFSKYRYLSRFSFGFQSKKIKTFKKRFLGCWNKIKDYFCKPTVPEEAPPMQCILILI